MNTDPLQIDCFTYDARTYNYARPIKPSKKIPQWWRDLPRLPSEGFLTSPRNMRTCWGFVELFKKGFLFCSWANFYLTITPNGITGKVDNGSIPESHPEPEYLGAFDNYHHLKLVNPWRLAEKTGVPFVLLSAEYFLTKYDFKILPGILEFSANRATHINTIFPIKEQEYTVHIPFGTPLAHLIPLTDTKIDLNFHHVSEEIYNDLMIKDVNLNFRKRLEYVKEHQDECPFHNNRK